MKPDMKRMLRLDGEKPTARERWKAFYSLWRASRAEDSQRECQDAWRVLFPAWRWIRLMNQTGDLWELNRFMPKEVRRQRVERARQDRIADNLGKRLLHAIMSNVE